MSNLTKELSNFHLAVLAGEEWVDIECDGCGATLGACPSSEYPSKELVLCGHCDYTCCSYTTLEQVDPVKYADEIKKQKDEISKYLNTARDEMLNDNVDDDNIPF